MSLPATEKAVQRIAPSWPLDQMIAVNPWWEMRDEPMPKVAARLAALSSVHCLMPKSYFAGLWQNTITAQDLHQAATELKVEASARQLRAHLVSAVDIPHWHNVSDLLDSGRDRQHQMAWRDEIIHQISQFCGDVFQRKTEPAPAEFYQKWLDTIRHDPGIAILMDEKDLEKQFDALPEDHHALLQEAITELDVDDAILTDYFHALLLDVNGWASWTAYLRWQANFQHQALELTEALLAIRLGWELVLWRHTRKTRPQHFHQLRFVWLQQQQTLPSLLDRHHEEQALTWVWQRAAEMAYQRQVQRALLQKDDVSGPPPIASNAHAELQAIFCIDVRSEVIRRALEAQHPAIQTRGFAGFFGLPIAYQPAGAAFSRPQLPGLLSPALSVTECGSSCATSSPEASQKTWRANTRWQHLGNAGPASFSLVESCGLLYAFKLLKDSVFPGPAKKPIQPGRAGNEWTVTKDGTEIGLADKVELVSGILTAMGLTDRIGKRVMLVGHGSESANNPHAAALDCGACGGQSGEVNVRILAQLLNNEAVRTGLTAVGIHIPSDTRFIPALHNTTTEELVCLQPSDRDATLGQWLDKATALANHERAPSLGLQTLKPGSLGSAIKKRSQDWSQVRPEWGLAGNAAFIVAPRDKTRQSNLEGRSFLHDYDWRSDQGFKLLELIMTAPMVVTNWINLQYYASTTDNLKYGSGNKVLHNVVGGHLGVFEGNGGDLRIGLPIQSLHDGERWMHAPLRLSVYIDAPRDAIQNIIEAHDDIAHLVNNEWLYLFRLDESNRCERFLKGCWN